MKFLKSLFGASAEKHEEKADELRLDFEYKDSAYFYQQALEALDAKDPSGAERLRRKLREVRRQALNQLLEEADELSDRDAPDLAQEKLQTALGFADDESSRREVSRRMELLAERFGVEEAPVEVPEEVSASDEDLFELSLASFAAADRERALALGEPFREAFELCQKESWEEARTRFEALLGSHPEDPLILEFAGICAENAGQLEDAVALWKRSYGKDPGRPAVIQGLASVSRRQGRPADARAILAQAVESKQVGEDLPEAWVPVFLEHALLMSEDGHHQHAVSAAAVLLDVRAADQGLVLYNLAGILERAGRHDDCRAALERAIQLYPRRALYRERLADFLVERRSDLEAALSLLVSANEVETSGGGGGTLGGGVAGRAFRSPNRGRYLYKTARIYFLLGEDLEAERTIATALAVTRDPEVVRALEALKTELKETGSRS